MGIEVANTVVAALFGSNGVLTNTAAAYNPKGNIFGVQRVAREAGREVLKERLPARGYLLCRASSARKACSRSSTCSR